MWPRLLIGALLGIVGLVWFGQGIGLIGGSFMTGQAVWAIIGAVFVIFAALLVRQGLRPSETDDEEAGAQ